MTPVTIRSRTPVPSSLHSRTTTLPYLGLCPRRRRVRRPARRPPSPASPPPPSTGAGGSPPQRSTASVRPGPWAGRRAAPSPQLRWARTAPTKISTVVWHGSPLQSRARPLPPCRSPKPPGTPPTPIRTGCAGLRVGGALRGEGAPLPGSAPASPCPAWPAGQARGHRPRLRSATRRKQPSAALWPATPARRSARGPARQPTRPAGHAASRPRKAGPSLLGYRAGLSKHLKHSRPPAGQSPYRHADRLQARIQPTRTTPGQPSHPAARRTRDAPVRLPCCPRVARSLRLKSNILWLLYLRHTCPVLVPLRRPGGRVTGPHAGRAPP